MLKQFFFKTFDVIFLEEGLYYHGNVTTEIKNILPENQTMTPAALWRFLQSVHRVQVLLDLLRGLSHELAHLLVFGPVLHLTFPE